MRAEVRRRHEKHGAAVATTARSCTSCGYVEVCDSAGICREYTAPVKPQQTAVVESATWRTMKDGLAARREIRPIFWVLISRESPTSAPIVTVSSWKLLFGLRTILTHRRPRPTPGGVRRPRLSSREYRPCR